MVNKVRSRAIPFGHIIYIPLCVIGGFILGWYFGRRSAAQELLRLSSDLQSAEERERKYRLSSAVVSEKQSV